MLLLLLCKKQKRKDHPISLSLSLYIALFRIDCKKRRPSRLLALNKGMDIFPIGYPDPHLPLFPPTFFLKKKKKNTFLNHSFSLTPSFSVPLSQSSCVLLCLSLRARCHEIVDLPLSIQSIWITYSRAKWIWQKTVGQFA